MHLDPIHDHRNYRPSPFSLAGATFHNSAIIISEGFSRKKWIIGTY
ncbi:MAG: hypothetical protein WA364_16080 [Candidatus Nitrosopolaris sp.]